MSAQGTGGQGIEDLYRSVMNDVINQVKEAFLDENVDVDVLYQLKRVWEDKVNQSGAVDLTPKQIQAPAMRQQPRPTAVTNRGGVALSQPAPSAGPSMVSQRPNPIQQSYQQQQVSQVQAQSQPVQFIQATTGAALSQPGFFHLPTNAIRVVPQQGNYVQSTSGGLPANFIMLPNGQIAQVVQPGVQSNVIQSSVRPQMQAPTKSEAGMNYINQLDGASHIPDEEPKKVQKSTKPKKIVQLDGGPGLSDSSSEEELEDEEDDPLRRIADRIGGEGDAGDEDDKVAEESSLSSRDDQSDEEDLQTLFDSSNVVVCQFEKVHRARNKWKFSLKDGIMNINGKDYCFQKCTGEAEW